DDHARWQDQGSPAVCDGRSARAGVGPLRAITTAVFRERALQQRKPAMKSIPQSLLVLAAAAALSACSSVKLDDQAPVESRSGAAVVPGNQNAARDAASQTRVAPVTASGGDMAGLGNI